MKKTPNFWWMTDRRWRPVTNGRSVGGGRWIADPEPLSELAAARVAAAVPEVCTHIWVGLWGDPVGPNEAMVRCAACGVPHPRFTGVL